MAVIGRFCSNHWYDKLLSKQLFCPRLPYTSVPVGNENKTKEDELPKQTLNISDNCIKRLSEIINDNSFLRIYVEGGGCSGFQYKFDLDKELEKEDIVFKKDGFKVVVDEKSLEYIKGSTIDYQTELIRSAFRIVDNPQAAQGCSCVSCFQFI
ncbi:conserved hypothetical protein [Pediculus humanus corporis]|uniref:Iron-sulfur cluster assembly 2 homolog, mitochondrial n=1 Tax=Pediculus humanus subsp. corporis TaxID=121224 RepID=E0VYF8_PEDHC|nr:uncharacterized protein Phum_PHUM513970 [Pediculus humanus corporis]EEB18414.1 conserved hypothetical protein [Pediculus humanus corporis]